MPYTVICQKWEESERGWGVRPDGYSLHIDADAHKRFVEAHYARMRATYGDEAPDEYTRISGEFYQCPVTEEIYLIVKAADNGIRSYTLADKVKWVNNRTPPWPNPTSGWRGCDGSPRLDKAPN